MNLKGLFLGLGCGLVLGCAAAAESSRFSDRISRAVEMPAHRALMRLRDRPDTVLTPFETDGCSGGLSEAWKLVADQFPQFQTIHDRKPPWEYCCVIHDRAYHDISGATDATASFDARLTADRALETCVIATAADRREALAVEYDLTPDEVATAYETIAGGMFLAVRFGGAPCSGLPWRWGYGYPGCSVLTGVLDNDN